jgi:hypothetical protein
VGKKGGRVDGYFAKSASFAKSILAPLRQLVHAACLRWKRPSRGPSMKSRDQAAYFCNHPPRCVAGFVTSPVRLDGFVFDGHASGPPSNVAGTVIEGSQHLNIVFLLACACGCQQHSVVGFHWRNPDYRNESILLSPIALRCALCGRETELIDTDRHGYNAEIGSCSSTRRAEGERGDYRCEKCSALAIQVCVRFEYPDDLFDSGIDGFSGREQDLFSWFSMVGKCPNCSRLFSITDFECA